MSADVSVHSGAIVKINLKPSAYEITINSCPTTDCANYGDVLDVKFCSACGVNTAEITVKEYGVITWDDFMESRDYHGEDVLIEASDDAGGFQILTYYEWKGDTLTLDPDTGNVATIEELQADSVRSIAAFKSEHAELIRDAEEFFGDRFSYDYGVCSYWSC